MVAVTGGVKAAVSFQQQVCSAAQHRLQTAALACQEQCNLFFHTPCRDAGIWRAVQGHDRSMIAHRAIVFCLCAPFIGCMLCLIAILEVIMTSFAQMQVNSGDGQSCHMRNMKGPTALVHAANCARSCCQHRKQRFSSAGV
jgi:hypothetical protein